MFLFCLVFAVSLCASVCVCWERADLLAVVCGVFCGFVTFPWYRGSGVVLDFIDS